MITIPMTVQASAVTIPMGVSATSAEFSMSIGVSYAVIQADPYDGSYEVTPRLYAQSLNTDGKLMRDDVTVYEIPVTYTSNIEGGKTVLIG